MTELTTRFGLPKPDSDNSESPAGPAEIGALADAIDSNMAGYSSGILSSRPVSTSGSPGIDGRLYYVKGDSTPGNNGVLWLDFGTGWVTVNSPGAIVDTYANRPAANGVPAGTKFFATDQVSEYVSNGTAWIRTTTPAGVIAICLLGTADPGYILLQGQAWPSTSGIYTDLHTKWGGTTLPGTFNGNAPVGYKPGDADFGTLGATVGEKRHTLAPGELPNYDLPYTDLGHLHTFGGSGGVSGSGGGIGGVGSSENTSVATTGITIHSGGSGLSHNNLQPSVVVNYQAKL